MHHQFRIMRNNISYETQQKKKEYYKQYFTRYKKNLKKLWNGIRTVINVKSKNYAYPTCIEDKDTIITTPKEISQSFNEYFSTVADKILEKRKFTGNKSYRDFLSNRLLENFIFQECDEEEV